jgi:hypothetical protein
MSMPRDAICVAQQSAFPEPIARRSGRMSKACPDEFEISPHFRATQAGTRPAPLQGLATRKIKYDAVPRLLFRFPA